MAHKRFYGAAAATLQALVGPRPCSETKAVLDDAKQHRTLPWQDSTGQRPTLLRPADILEDIEKAEVARAEAVGCARPDLTGLRRNGGSCAVDLLKFCDRLDAGTTPYDLMHNIANGVQQLCAVPKDSPAHWPAELKRLYEDHVDVEDMYVHARVRVRAVACAD